MDAAYYSKFCQQCFTLIFAIINIDIATISNIDFINCYNLCAFVMPMNATGTCLFSACYKMEGLKLREGTTTIAVNAFQANYAMKNLNFPSSVSTISNSSFNGSGIRIVIFPSGIPSVGNSTCYNCYSARSITIPASVTSIGTYAFANCYACLEYVLEPTTPPTLASINAFTNINNAAKIKVPSASLAAYQAATNWSTYADYMEGY